MAIAAGSIVALKIASAQLAFGSVQAQPPVFGISEGAAGGAVNWFNGTHVAAVAAGQLDEIVTADVTTLALVGKVVAVEGQSASYRGIVISAYNRSGTLECVLVKTLQDGAFIELDATTVTAVPGL